MVNSPAAVLSGVNCQRAGKLSVLSAGKVQRLSRPRLCHTFSEGEAPGTRSSDFGRPGSEPNSLAKASASPGT